MTVEGLVATGLFWEKWPSAGLFGKSCRRGEIEWTLTDWPEHFDGTRTEIDEGFFSTSRATRVRRRCEAMRRPRLRFGNGRVCA